MGEDGQSQKLSTIEDVDEEENKEPKLQRKNLLRSQDITKALLSESGEVTSAIGEAENE